MLIEMSPLAALRADQAVLEAKGAHQVVAKIPAFSFSIPDSSSRSHLLLQFSLIEVYSNTYNLMSLDRLGFRIPINFLDDQLDCLEPFLRLGIISIPDADKTISIFSNQSPGATLAGL